MRVALLIMSIIALTLSGCVTAHQQWAESNFFYSPKGPSAKVQLENGFTFTGLSTYHGWTVDLDAQSKDIASSVTAFSFEENQGDREMRLVIANNRAAWPRLTTYFVPDLSKGINPLRTGFLKQEDVKYETSVVLRENGESGTALEKHYGRLLVAGTYFYITYAEPFKGEQTLPISNQELTEFEIRADQSFTLLPYDVTDQQSVAGLERFQKQFSGAAKNDPSLELYVNFAAAYVKRRD